MNVLIKVAAEERRVEGVVSQCKIDLLVCLYLGGGGRNVVCSVGSQRTGPSAQAAQVRQLQA